MTRREDYLRRMRAALDHLQVKAGLAKLELADVRRDLSKEYDAVHDRLAALGEATEDRWDALRAGFEAAYRAFRDRYHDVMAMHQHD